MITYYFCNKLDATKEPIGVCQAPSIEEAVVYFAKRKRLNIDDFLKLYSVNIKQLV